MSDGLEDRPFAWTRRGRDVLITHRGRPAAILRREAADRFLGRLDTLDEDGAQQLMARVTGNFKRGNERR
ncbi:MAG TPA: hypothetical protein VH859_05570 [Candidatus Limnocylindria bacterium]|jgi:hypothetical protein